MNSHSIKNHCNLIYWLFAFTYWEILAHAGMFGQFQASFRFALGITWAMALLLSLLTDLLPQKLLFPINLLLTLGLLLVYGSQMVYFFIFGTPYSVFQMGLGAGAISQFWREMFGTMRENWPWLLGLFLPPLGLIVLSSAHCFGKPGRISWAAMAMVAGVLLLATWMDIGRGGRNMFSDYYFLTSPKSTTAQTMERFGVPASFLLELTRPEDGSSSMSAAMALPQTTVPTAAPDSTVPEETRPPVTYNVLPIDFDALNAKTDDADLITLNSYFSQLPGTCQNEYTGKLRDYNLILICAESFSPAAVDPKYTPTLYKLTHEGFVFRNYYNTFPNTTTDGEYALTQGLFPDSTRDKYSSSMMASADNYLPFALGNLFHTQLGVKCHGYHNNVGNYYRRDLTHPNMGYEMKFNKSGMTFTGYWPTSDLEMMEQSVDDYIHDPQFHAYYMTFSGHYQYNPKENGVALRNYRLVEDAPWPMMGQKGYMACHIELDKALEYLLSRLEEEGVADKTAIVLASDHTPYGLNRGQYFEMIGQEDDFFSWYKSDLIFWVGGMKEPVVVDEYCCNVDILPTILNLWGFPYDSRMFPGTDVFSDGVHAAVLIDHSFLTDQVWFNSNTGEIRYQVSEETVSDTYVESMNQMISAKFEASAGILRKNYYQYVFGNQSP